jgi:hypothetical protein
MESIIRLSIIMPCLNEAETPNFQLPELRIIYRFEPETFPVDAIRWLASNPQAGRTFNDLNWGGYLVLNLHSQETARLFGRIKIAHPTGWFCLLSCFFNSRRMPVFLAVKV